MKHESGNLIALSFMEIEKLKSAPKSVIMVYLSILKAEREGVSSATTEALCRDAGVCSETVGRAFTSLRMLGLIEKPSRYTGRKCVRVASPQLPLY